MTTAPAVTKDPGTPGFVIGCTYSVKGSEISLGAWNDQTIAKAHQQYKANAAAGSVLEDEPSLGADAFAYGVDGECWTYIPASGAKYLSITIIPKANTPARQLIAQCVTGMKDATG